MNEHTSLAAQPAPAVIAAAIDRQTRAVPEPSTAAVREVRRAYSRRLRSATADDVLAVAEVLVDRQRWVAYELLYYHPSKLSQLDGAAVDRLGRGIDSWEAVDTFARYISGPAWRLGYIADAQVQGWAASPDRWWRRAALVSTVPLNLRAAGGTGDTARTLDICTRLVADRDDMVVKALSWALRELAFWDPESVRTFLAAHDTVLAPRVKREVGNKRRTGLKNPASNPAT
jgi:3-methyladenine DNA glycosylase AlkD